MLVAYLVRLDNTGVIALLPTIPDIPSSARFVGAADASSIRAKDFCNRKSAENTNKCWRVREILLPAG
jgi:hypothetical protein